MRSPRRTLAFGALLVLVALVLGSLASAQGPRRGGTLRIAQIGEPPTLDPSATTVRVTSNIGTAIFETPFAFDASWSPRPMLVESHATSQDGRTHTFKLRRGVLFHNGKEMGAEDVVASLTRWGKVGSRGAVVFRARRVGHGVRQVHRGHAAEGAVRATARVPGPAVLGGGDHAEGDRRRDAGRARHASSSAPARTGSWNGSPTGT